MYMVEGVGLSLSTYRIVKIAIFMSILIWGNFVKKKNHIFVNNRLITDRIKNPFAHNIFYVTHDYKRDKCV